ncbi:MAG: diguanylate cyclase [Thermodesulfobacteriota bacterium]
MDRIPQAVLTCLEANDDETRTEGLDALVARHGGPACQAILQAMAGLHLEAEPALAAWTAIRALKSEMSQGLGRPVSLHTAVCEHLLSGQPGLKSPMLVESELYQRLMRDSRLDGLTGLLNRQCFDEALAREVARARRHDKELALCLLDLDDFKAINDTCGHQAGDQVLREVASAILAEKREEDTAGRYGGEELVLVLPETGEADALCLAERIRRQVAAIALATDGHQLQVTVSGGVAALPPPLTSATELIRLADLALADAKAAGKNRVLGAGDSLDHRRRHHRVPYAGPLRVRSLDRRERRAVAPRGRDISMGGVLFETKSALAPGSRIQLTIPIDRDLPLVVVGTVLRAEEAAPDWYAIAASFVKMDRTVKTAIARYMQQHRDQPVLGTDEARLH